EHAEESGGEPGARRPRPEVTVAAFERTDRYEEDRTDRDHERRVAEDALLAEDDRRDREVRAPGRGGADLHQIAAQAQGGGLAAGTLAAGDHERGADARDREAGELSRRELLVDQHREQRRGERDERG